MINSDRAWLVALLPHVVSAEVRHLVETRRWKNKKPSEGCLVPGAPPPAPPLWRAGQFPPSTAIQASRASHGAASGRGQCRRGGRGSCTSLAACPRTSHTVIPLPSTDHSWTQGRGTQGRGNWAHLSKGAVKDPPAAPLIHHRELFRDCSSLRATVPCDEEKLTDRRSDRQHSSCNLACSWSPRSEAPADAA